METVSERYDAFEREWGLGPYYRGPWIDKYRTHIWVRQASHGIDGTPMSSQQKFALMLLEEYGGPVPKNCWPIGKMASAACMTFEEMYSALTWLVENRFLQGATFLHEHVIGTLACPLEVDRETRPSTEAVRRKNRLAEAKKVGGHTRREWVAMLQFCGLRCLACGDEGEMTKDHIVAIANGGDDRITNLQPICSACNSSKHTQPWGDLRPAGWQEAVAARGGRHGD